MLIKDKTCDYKNYANAARAAMGSEIETTEAGNPGLNTGEIFLAETLNVTPSNKPTGIISVDKNGIHGMVRDNQDYIAGATINPDGSMTTNPAAKPEQTQALTKMLQTFKDNLGCKS